jgi:hypothetical protein
MSLLGRAKAVAEQAAAKVHEGADQAAVRMQKIQARRELDRSYTELGRCAFKLIERGEFQHAELTAAVDDIRAAMARFEQKGGEAGASREGDDASPAP